MYSLTDFSLTELRELSYAVTDRIDYKNKHIMQIEHWFEEVDSPTKKRLLEKPKSGMAELREMNVRILTAINIVKQRETTHAN